MKSNLLKNPTFTRVAPFVLFLAFIALEQGLRALLESQVVVFDASILNWLYLPKTLLVGWVL